MDSTNLKKLAEEYRDEGERTGVLAKLQLWMLAEIAYHLARIDERDAAI